MEITSLAVTMKIVAALTEAADMSGSPSASPLLSLAKTLEDGAGAGKAQLVWFDDRLLAGAADDDLDLAGGLTSIFGKTLTFTKVKVIALLNMSDVVSTTPAHDPATSAGIQLGGGDGGDGTNAFDTWITANGADGSEAVLIPVGGGMILFNRTSDGYAVTGGAGDILRVLNLHGADEARYQIMIVGEGTEA
jgi:hypothetical protein